MIELKPCPFCGGEARVEDNPLGTDNEGGNIRGGVGLGWLWTVECERLQGFPDGWTAIPWRGKPAEECPDTPRYKALGNSMAVPVMRWIGERIAMVEEAAR